MAHEQTESRERTLLVLSLATWLTSAALALVLSPPLGHDEAQYAVAARQPAPPWLYLSPGTVALARVGLIFGTSDWIVRLLPALFGSGLIVATWWLGRLVCGPRVGGWAAAVIAGAHPLAMRNAELLGDLPAAACLLAGVALLVRELDGRERPSYALVLVAPAFAAAFYLRYGSAPVIAVIAIVAFAFWWRRIVAHPLPTLATLGAFAALLAPHAIYSLQVTGSILGVLRLSASVPYRSYPGEGLVQYVTSNPLMFYGVLVAPLMIAGVVGLFVQRSRARVFLAVLAIVQIVMLGLQTRAQPRYVCFATILLVILGVDAVLRSRAARYVWIGRALVALSWIGAVVATAMLCAFLTQARAPIMRAIETVDRDAAGRPCAVAGRAVPQMLWNAKCTVLLAGPTLEWPANHRRYIIEPADTKNATVPGYNTGVEVVPASERSWRVLRLE